MRESDFGALVRQWLAESEAAATTRTRCRRALMDWAGYLAARHIDPFGPDIEDTLSDWESHMSGRLAEATAMQRLAAVADFYDFCDRSPAPAPTLPLPEGDVTVSPSAAARAATLRAAIAEYNTRRRHGVAS